MPISPSGRRWRRRFRPHDAALLTLPFGAFVTVWTILAMNIISPGPNVLNTITTAMGSGRAAGLASALAVGLGIGIWCLAMSLGMAAMFRLLPLAETAMTLVAAALLGYFAARYLRAAFRSAPDTSLVGRGGLGLGAAFLRSLSINATNPKALTTWIAILGIFPTAEARPGDIALLTFGACVISLTIHTLYALAFSTPAAGRAYRRAAPVISGLVGLFFLGFAARLALPLLYAGF